MKLDHTSTSNYMIDDDGYHKTEYTYYISKNLLNDNAAVTDDITKGVILYHDHPYSNDKGYYPSKIGMYISKIEIDNTLTSEYEEQYSNDSQKYYYMYFNKHNRDFNIRLSDNTTGANTKARIYDGSRYFDYRYSNYDMTFIWNANLYENNLLNNYTTNKSEIDFQVPEDNSGDSQIFFDISMEVN